MPYISDIFRHKTHPHAFSWLVWSALAAINFGIMLRGQGGAGAIVWAVIMLASLLVFVLALFYSERNISFVDWVSLAVAGVASVLWLIVKQPLLSVILISSVEIFGAYFPTFRKSYLHPEQETVAMYALSALVLVFSISASTVFSVTNLLYPATCMLLNAALAVFLIVRKRQLRRLKYRRRVA